MHTPQIPATDTSPPPLFPSPPLLPSTVQPAATESHSLRPGRQAKKATEQSGGAVFLLLVSEVKSQLMKFPVHSLLLLHLQITLYTSSLSSPFLLHNLHHLLLGIFISLSSSSSNHRLSHLRSIQPLVILPPTHSATDR